MADYLRARSPESSHPFPSQSSSSSHYLHTSSSASRSLPLRQASAPVSSSLPYYSSPPKRDNDIRCSDCGDWVDLMRMGEHVCRPTGGVEGIEREAERRHRPEMRVDTSAAVPKAAAYGASLSARSPNPGYLGPSSPVPSRPTSPSNGVNELSRSVSSQSSTSSNGAKLPFFERYQKMVQGPGGTTITCSGSSPDNLTGRADGSSQSSPLTPAGFAPYISRSPSPSQSTFLSSNSYPCRADSANNSLRAASPQPSIGSHRSTTSRSSDRPDERETPASSILSSSPPRSRKISMGERGPDSFHSSSSSSSSSTASTHYDSHRATITASRSTPAKLSSFDSCAQLSSSARPSTLPDAAPPERKGSAAGLDACLEDLRMMTEDDDGGTAMLEDFFGPSSHVDDVEDETTTPRPPTRSPLPYSRSSPALAAAVLPISRLRTVTDLVKTSVPATSECTTCRRSYGAAGVQKAGDGQVFCRPCYAERFLPKCRKCKKAIEGGAVTSSDGKVTGKYHPACFSCFSCSAPFPNKEFYVFEQKPYCQHHYHELNGSLCSDKDCGEPIEGPCVSLVGEENGGGGRYHVEHFRCAHRSCGVALLDHHFVVGTLPYCERHEASAAAAIAAAAEKVSSSKPARGGAPVVRSTTRSKKRQTIITKR